MGSMDRHYGTSPIELRAPSSLQRSLLRLPLFEGLDAETLVRITDGASEYSLQTGVVVFRRGDPSKGLYVVVEGLVKLALHTPHGGEKVVELIGTGGCIGVTTIASGCPYMLTAETMMETRLVHLAKIPTQEELERSPVFARGIISTLSERLHQLIAAFEDFMLRPGSERVARYLLERLPRDAREGDVTITLAFKKGIIASQLNLTQEHFSRMLRELALKGLIEVKGRHVRVSDVAQLRAHAAKSPALTRTRTGRPRLQPAREGLADLGVDGNDNLVVTDPDRSR
jgi:CRP-like cAMP-binding protein